jgi:DNA repair ATPase RecN|tara:strand:- start:287 stop:493 length:207 start_codon:yes stop_codon:yes gene_type:complete
MQWTAEELEKQVKQTRKELLDHFKTLSSSDRRRLEKLFESLERLQQKLQYRKFRDRERAEARWMHGEY